MVVAAFATLSPSARADELADGPSKVKVESVVPLQARAFPLQDVRLLDGPFKHAMELDRQVPAVAGRGSAAAHLPRQRGPALVGQAARRLGGAQGRAARPFRRPLSHPPAP